MALPPQLLIQFLAVYQLGSLGRACRALNISQPALSKSMRRLEDLLGVSLFERGPSGMQPTACASALARRAEIVKSEIALAETEVALLRDGHAGELKIGAGPAVASFLLPDVIQRLLNERPALHVTVIEGLYDVLSKQVATGALDLAITTSPAVRHCSDLPSVSLFREKFVVAASASHPLAAKARLRTCDLIGWPWVLPPRDGILWQRIVDAFALEGLQPPVPNVETNSDGCIKGLLAGSLFLSVIPHQLIAKENARGEVRVLDLPGLRVEREIIALMRNSEVLTPATEQLLDLVRQALADYGRTIRGQAEDEDKGTA
jgi:DNA-binding transcriptional LysR family regulator